MIKCLLGVFCVLACAADASAQYAFVEIPLLPGTSHGGAYGVNEAGDVVGWCRDSATNMYYGFLYKSDTAELINIGPLGTQAAGYLPGAWAINDSREVVGVWGCSCAGGVRSFYWTEDDGFVNISYQPRPQDVVNSGAYDINDSGQVAGFNTLLCLPGSFSGVAAALWDDPTDPQTPPVAVFGTSFPCGIGGFGLGMNDAGTVSGWVQVLEGFTSWQRAIVGGSILPTFSPAQGGHSEALDVNNSGFACGYSEDRSGTGPASSACYWTPSGQIERLISIPANSIFARALAINNAGDIVGYTGPEIGSRATLWASLNADPVDLNTLLTNSPGAGRFLFTAEDISDSGYIVGRLGLLGIASRPYLLVPCDQLGISAPVDTTSCATGPAEFSVTAPGATAFRWQVNTGTSGSPFWCDLEDGIGGGACVAGQSLAVFTGTGTPSLTISSMTAVDARQYRCVATSGCDQQFSDPANLFVCTADLNCDSSMDFFDISAFLTAYGASDPLADFNNDGDFSFFDISFFLQAYSAGCP